MNRITKPDFFPKTNILNLSNPGIGKNLPKMEPMSGDLMEEMAKKAKEQSEKMQKQIMEYYKQITGNNRTLLRFILIVAVIITILVIVFYISNRLKRNSNNIDRLKDNSKKFLTFKENNGLNSIINFSYEDSYDKVHKRPSTLKDYYILGSYNSCCGGEVFNNWVDLGILENTIKMGPRVLDFEVFSQYGKPIVAASLKNATKQQDTSYSKDTLNHLEIPEVLATCKKAFQGIITQNYDDLLILNFRIKTMNGSALDTLAKNIRDAFKSQLLESSTYGFGGRNKNVVNEDIKKLRRKVIVSIYDTTNTFKDTELYSITNICNNMEITGMGGVEYLKNYDIQYGTDKEDMLSKNKLSLKIVLPDETNEKDNPPSQLHRDVGCQISLMRFTLYDSNLKETLAYYSKNDSAFVLKPDEQRYKPIILAKPKPMDPRVQKVLLDNS